MRKLYVLVAWFFPFSLWAQTSSPYGLWEDQQNLTYHFVSIDPSTATFTPVNSIFGMTGVVVPGTSTIKTSTNEYVFIGQFASQSKLVALDIATGNVNAENAIAENWVGLEYNCVNDTIYALWQFGNNYSLISINPATAQKTVIGNLPGVSAYAGGTFALNPGAGTYSFIGLVGPTFTIFNVDIRTGTILNQNPFPENVVGIEYDCRNNRLIGQWEDRNLSICYMVEINPVLGTFDTLFSMPAVTPGFISEAHAFNPLNQQYTFRGFMGSVFTLFAVDMANGTISHDLPFSRNAIGYEEDICCSAPCPVPGAHFGFGVQDGMVSFSDSSSLATSWFWDFGDGSTDTSQNPQHLYAASGDYVVCLIATNACGSDTLCDTVTVVITSRDFQVGAVQFEVYPNPARGEVRIEFGNMGFEWVELICFDIAGRKVRESKLGHATPMPHWMEISDLLPGVYLLRMRTDRATFTKKLVVVGD